MKEFLDLIKDIEAKLSIAKEKIKESESIISDLGEDFNEEACDNCPSCLAFKENNHPDIDR